MEECLNSMNKDLSSKGTTGSLEESGWTAYFEDFLSNNKEYSSCSSGFGSSSLVSDAASCAAWKLSDKDRAVGHSSVLGSEKSCKKLSFKKRTRRVVDDDSLEDTASSPVNSPKVSDLKQFDMNPRKKDENLDTSKGNGKGNTSGHYSELQTDERNDLGFNGRDNDCTELKKRGLCLVPLSMLMNYLG